MTPICVYVKRALSIIVTENGILAEATSFLSVSEEKAPVLHFFHLVSLPNSLIKYLVVDLLK